MSSYLLGRPVGRFPDCLAAVCPLVSSRLYICEYPVATYLEEQAEKKLLNSAQEHVLLLFYLLLTLRSAPPSLHPTTATI